MQILVNGEARQIANDSSISQLLSTLELDGRHDAARSRSTRSWFPAASTPPSSQRDDRVEIVQAIGGG
jgi:sulfur carrier protein ThiS